MLFSKKSLQQNIKLFPVDFQSPWWHLILRQKWLVLFIALVTINVRAFASLVPFMIAYLFSLNSVQAWIIFCATWVSIEILHVCARQMNARFQLQCIHSIYQSAHQFLLTVDPRYHVHKSSGAILGKIDRAARGYEELLDQIAFEFAPLITSLIAITCALGTYSKAVAIAVTFFFILMIVVGYYFGRYASQRWEQAFIVTDDQFRSCAVENLAQAQLVRTVFASDYMSRRLTNKIEVNMRSEGALWFGYITTTFVLNMFYLVALFCLFAALVYQVRAGITAIPAAIGLAVAYMQATRELVDIARPFRRYMRGLAAVTDLFNFMPTFGTQNYPVLGGGPALLPKAVAISVAARNISFDYETARLFNDHNFSLTCEQNRENKLYGIIGPSGSGKTTFISILGGQLKPLTGMVTINGINIYEVTDSVRRQLIALQSQVATGMRGTIRDNLLFGLPENHTYTNDDLLKILDRVGLLATLASHKGLDTMLGEGGLNLSGGQRQRLNFAGLYLRACYYKPFLILIDEPTSSLDELSEAAITHMIEELARGSVTLVIAHRLKTVEKAVGLIDLSLLHEEKNIVAYTAAELRIRSLYYHHLIQGKVQFDN